MSRAARILALLACWMPGALLAQDAAATKADDAAPAGDELKNIQQTLEQQSKQIDVLAQEIARLNLLLEAKTPIAPGLAASPAAEASAPEKPAADAPAPAAPVAKAMPVEAAAAPEASVAPAGPVHIVAKGETLTAIAKHYKVTVPELLKVNKIADVRKLQIGQSLTLPPGAKLQESPTPTPTSSPSPPP